MHYISKHSRLYERPEGMRAYKYTLHIRYNAIKERTPFTRKPTLNRYIIVFGGVCALKYTPRLRDIYCSTHTARKRNKNKNKISKVSVYGICSARFTRRCFPLEALN